MINDSQVFDRRSRGWNLFTRLNRLKKIVIYVYKFILIGECVSIYLINDDKDDDELQGMETTHGDIIILISVAFTMQVTSRYKTTLLSLHLVNYHM